MIDRLIVDADACIKLGGSEKFCFLQQLLPLLANKAFIHRHVYTEEILRPASVKTQLNKLISDGFLEIIDENTLTANEKAVFDAVYNALARVMLNPNKPRENLGEAYSLAMAKVSSIHMFLTDERDLQPIIDRLLNTGLDDINCIRLIDIIEK